MDGSPITGPYIFKLKSTTVQFKNGLTLKRHDQKLSAPFRKNFMVPLTEVLSLKMPIKEIINAS